MVSLGNWPTNREFPTGGQTEKTSAPGSAEQKIVQRSKVVSCSFLISAFSQKFIFLNVVLFANCVVYKTSVQVDIFISDVLCGHYFPPYLGLPLSQKVAESQ